MKEAEARIIVRNSIAVGVGILNGALSNEINGRVCVDPNSAKELVDRIGSLDEIIISNAETLYSKEIMDATAILGEKDIDVVTFAGVLSAINEYVSRNTERISEITDMLRDYAKYLQGKMMGEV